MFLPRTCPVCRRPGPAPCAGCIERLERAPALPAPPGVDGCRAVLAYEDEARLVITSLKYRNARSPLPWLAAEMAASVTAGIQVAADVVTWVPTSAARRRQRGFDQAQLLARAVAHQLRLPCRALLRRRAGPPQTGRTLAERQAGPPIEPRRPAPASVLLVDDVVTSGATVGAAARALRSVGARRVVVVAAARTPPRRRATRN